MSYEWSNWASYLSMYSIVIPTAVFFLRRKELGRMQKMIGVLVLMTILSEFAINFLSSQEINSLPALHLFTALQFIILVYILGKALTPLHSTRLLNGLVILFVLFVLIDAVFLSGINNFNSYSRPLASLILIFLVLSFFYKTLQELKIESLDREPIFWLNIGVLLYFSGSLFIFLFTNYFQTSNEALLTLWGIHAIFNIILNITYAIALWIRQAR